MINNLKLVIFDMDGTIFKSFLDWKNIKQELNIPKDKTILETIYNDNVIDYNRLNILLEHELNNTKKTTPFEHIKDFINILKSNNILLAILTNNNKKNTEFLLNKYKLKFDITITRESKLWKPSGIGLKYIMDYFNLNQNNTVSIGDSKYDIIASKDAGIKDIYIKKSNYDFDDKGVVYFNNYSELSEIFAINYRLNKWCRHADISFLLLLNY